MSEVKTLVTLVLGGMFDHNELGDIDLLYEAPACEALQRELVDSIDDVHVELVSRIDYDEAKSQLAALREELDLLTIQEQNTKTELASQIRHKERYKQRLTDAERRNAELDQLLEATRDARDAEQYTTKELRETLSGMNALLADLVSSNHAVVVPLEIWKRIHNFVDAAALNPNPEAASHDE